MCCMNARFAAVSAGFGSGVGFGVAGACGRVGCVVWPCVVTTVAAAAGLRGAASAAAANAVGTALSGALAVSGIAAGRRLRWRQL